jgi:hypothetical protein
MRYLGGFRSWFNYLFTLRAVCLYLFTIRAECQCTSALAPCAALGDTARTSLYSKNITASLISHYTAHTTLPIGSFPVVPLMNT